MTGGMKSKPSKTVQELEAAHDQLLQSVDLLKRIQKRNLPPFLEHVELKDVTAVLERAGALLQPATELSEFLADFVERSEDGLRTRLESTLNLLTAAAKRGEEETSRQCFGLLEAAFPVQVQGEVVHVLKLGPLLDASLTETQLGELAEVSGVSARRIRDATEGMAVASREEVDARMNACRTIRDLLRISLEQKIAAATLSHQLFQSEKTRSLGTLSAGVAHHFNNLLSVILGYASFVLNRGDHAKPAEAALHKIIDAAQRGRRLTEEILSFSGSGQEEEQPCHVHETLTSVLSLLQSEMSSRIKVSTDLKARHDTVVAPPSSVHQVVFNLLTNATDSLPNGGTLKLVTSNVKLETDPQQEYLKIEAVDSSGQLPAGFGSGKTAPVAPDAFTGDRAGMRLSNVYGMVGRMDGTVMVSTEPGSLTRVEVLLPAAPAKPDKGEAPRGKRRLAPSSVWVVDDDPIFREMCHQVLGEEGHAIEEFGDGMQMQNQWRNAKRRPDLVVMDFSMPELSGLELCEWLRGEGSYTPVILVSGFSASQPDIRKALKLKKVFFLQKPFTSRDLVDTVTVAMGETLIGDRLLTDVS